MHHIRKEERRLRDMEILTCYFVFCALFEPITRGQKGEIKEEDLKFAEGEMDRIDTFEMMIFAKHQN